ncbi:MAG: hypothetical protein JXR10_05275 [Cyclobacteriaceae bacterium]
MINQGKVWNYILYAIGEIVLVVVGILIAVQIDDWYDHKKKVNLEIKVLREIQVDLENDLIEIGDEIESYQWIANGSSSLEAYYFSKNLYTDSLGSFTYGYEISPHFNPIDGGYQLLKAKGIDLITNDSLRLEINTYYEQSIPYYLKYESERIQTTINDFISFNNANFYLSKVPYFPFWKRMPHNESTLRTNKEWISVIQKSSNLSQVLLSRAQNHERKIMRLQEMIKTELKQRN